MELELWEKMWLLWEGGDLQINDLAFFVLHGCFDVGGKRVKFKGRRGRFQVLSPVD